MGNRAKFPLCPTKPLYLGPQKVKVNSERTTQNLIVMFASGSQSNIAQTLSSSKVNETLTVTMPRGSRPRHLVVKPQLKPLRGNNNVLLCFLCLLAVLLSNRIITNLSTRNFSLVWSFLYSLAVFRC